MACWHDPQLGQRRVGGSRAGGGARAAGSGGWAGAPAGRAAAVCCVLAAPVCCGRWMRPCWRAACLAATALRDAAAAPARRRCASIPRSAPLPWRQAYLKLRRQEGVSEMGDLVLGLATELMAGFDFMPTCAALCWRRPTLFLPQLQRMLRQPERLLGETGWRCAASQHPRRRPSHPQPRSPLAHAGSHPRSRRATRR